jgi:hypothetical protein
MKDGAPAHVIPDRGVTALKDFLGEGSRPFSGRSAGKSPELSQSEVARVDANDIEKTGLRFGVAEFLDPLLFDPNVGNRNFSSNDLKTMPFGNEMFILGRSSARTTLREITVECASSSLEARNRQNVSKKNVSRSDRFFFLVRRFLLDPVFGELIRRRVFDAM